MSTSDDHARVARLLVRERNRRALSDAKQSELRERLRRAAAASDAAASAPWRHRAWRWLVVRPTLAVGVLCVCGGAAVALVGPRLYARVVTPKVEAPAPARPAPTAPVEIAAPAPDLGPALRAEIALIARARKELTRGQVEDAERSLAQHARRFPAGTLIEEREGLGVMVLWHRGAKAEARHAAGRFRLRYPQSPMMKPMIELLGEVP